MQGEVGFSMELGYFWNYVDFGGSRFRGIDDSKLPEITTRVQINQVETDLYKHFAM